MNERAPAPPSSLSPPLPSGLWPLALLAVVAPTLLAASDPPSITFYNQALAVFGWGLWMAALGLARGARWGASVQGSGPWTALSAVLWLYAGAALGSVWVSGLPLGLGLMGAGLALSAWVVLAGAWQSAQAWSVAALMDMLCRALAWAGVVGLVLAVIQVFAPSLADGMLIAETAMPGRAVGNLRQPNHFSTLLFWSACAVAWLGRRGRWPVGLAAALLVMLVGAVVWTASRTGMVAMLLLTLWGWRDRQMPRPLRWLLMAAPVVYGLWWLGMAAWAQSGAGHSFAGQARLHDGSDISSSRFGIWSDTLGLIRQHVWTGVGWGEFNLAWTFSEFPNRPIAFFDHTHNVLLQWAVELGVPMAVLLTALTTWALAVLWWPWREDAEGITSASATMVTMVGLHSLLEYPLWYSYFLLPAAFMWGLGLAARAGLAPPEVTPALHAAGQHRGGAGWQGAVAPALVMLGALWCAVDYQWAANIYAPRPWAGPLDERIKDGKRMPWFGYQADYAHVTGPDEDESSLPPQAFSRTLHNLVDARLMIAYARSLAEHGRVDEARYVVQRLKEFRNNLGREFLAVCDAPVAPPPAQRPFQCEPPKRAYTWRQVLP